MRTDAVIDKRAVRCPNATLGGYNKWRAQVGDLIWYKEGGVYSGPARMIGRIKYAPSLGAPETQPIRDHILVVQLGADLTYCMERWINPKDVTLVLAPSNQLDVMAYFMGPDMLTAPMDEVRRAASELWSTLGAYREWKQKAGIADREEVSQ